ncbi:MAG: exosortase [Verrucomicrobia bacterium]|nr:exosortase [Verrucomicrobiota bacterium]
MAVSASSPLDRWVEFKREWSLGWQSMPDKRLFGALLVGWLLLFQYLGNSTFGYVDTPSLFAWMDYAYSMLEDDRHCRYIPLVVLALFWWKRRQLWALPKRPWWPALGMVIGALLLHLAGLMMQQTRVSIVAFFLGLYGLTGLVWGRAWLCASFFPFVLFAFCVPLGTLADTITFPLRMLVTNLSVGIARDGLGIDVVKVGTQIFDSQRLFNFDVAPACSGIRSLTALLALTTIYGFVTFKAGWKRLLMVLIAAPLAVIGNVARITGVIITADAFGQRAGTRFHDGAGFVTFAVALACVMALGYWLREDRQPALAEGAAK